MAKTNTKQKLFQILFISLIIGVLFFMGWMIFWITSESGHCIKDPLEFYAEKMDQECDQTTGRYEISCVPIIFKNNQIVSTPLLISNSS